VSTSSRLGTDGAVLVRPEDRTRVSTLASNPDLIRSLSAASRRDAWGVDGDTGKPFGPSKKTAKGSELGEYNTTDDVGLAAEPMWKKVGVIAAGVAGVVAYDILSQ
jgi:hypothetical protein